MRKIEEEVLRSLDALGAKGSSFAEIKDKIDMGRVKQKRPHVRKTMPLIAGTGAAFLLMTAIVPTAVCLSSAPHPNGENIFDDKTVTVEFLKEQDCLFYENLVFAEDRKNHVFVTEGNAIVEHYSYSKVEFRKESFDCITHMALVDAVEYVGLPSFMGISSEPSLDYSCVDGYIRRLKLTKSDEGLLIDDIEVLDKENPSTWFDPDKTDLPSLEQCQQIKIGMSLDEVVRRIGKPQRDVGSGAQLFRFAIDNGSYLTILFGLDLEKENEFVQNNPNIHVYGTHFLFVEDFWIHEYTVPPVDTL